MALKESGKDVPEIIIAVLMRVCYFGRALEGVPGEAVAGQHTRTRLPWRFQSEERRYDKNDSSQIRPIISGHRLVSTGKNTVQPFIAAV